MINIVISVMICDSISVWLAFIVQRIDSWTLWHNLVFVYSITQGLHFFWTRGQQKWNNILKLVV